MRLSCGTIPKFNGKFLFEMNGLIVNKILNINGVDCDLNRAESLSWLEASEEPHLAELSAFLRQWADSGEYLIQQTSGSTGSPKLLKVRRSQMLHSARLTIEFFGLRQGMTALLCMSPAFIGGRMMVIRALVAGMKIVVVKPEENPLVRLNQKIDFAAMVPFQFSRTIKENPEKFALVDKLILGGGPVPKLLEDQAQNIKTEVWHTYGMSETLSHIALRPINGQGRSARFRLLPGISLRLDDRSCLVIDAPHLNEETLITNDIGRIYPDGTFEILGRADNVIVSAGHKIHVENLEQQIAAFLDTPFIISSLPDNEAGEVVVLVIGESPSPRRLFELWKMLESALDNKDLPRRMITLDQIPLTGSGKPHRQTIREKLAAKP